VSRASRPPFRNPVYALALRKYGQGPCSASGPITHLQAREGSGVAHSGGERGNGGGGAVVSRHPGTPTDPTAEHTSVLHALSGTMAGVLAKELSREAEVGPALTDLPGAQILKPAVTVPGALLPATHPSANCPPVCACSAAPPNCARTRVDGPWAWARAGAEKEVMELHVASRDLRVWVLQELDRLRGGPTMRSRSTRPTPFHPLHFQPCQPLLISNLPNHVPSFWVLRFLQPLHPIPNPFNPCQLFQLRTFPCPVTRRVGPRRGFGVNPVLNTVDRGRNVMVTPPLKPTHSQ
jgi:hypothetical protein